MRARLETLTRGLLSRADGAPAGATRPGDLLPLERTGLRARDPRRLRPLLWLVPAAAGLSALVMLAIGPQTTAAPPDATSVTTASLRDEAPPLPAPPVAPVVVPAEAMAPSPAVAAAATEATAAPVPVAPPSVPAETAPRAASTPAPAEPIAAAAAPPPPDAPQVETASAAPAPAPAADPAPTVVAAVPPAASPAGPAADAPEVSLSRDEVAAHLAKGEEKLEAGEVAVARLYFERVARSGDARGAIGMAKTFDPAELAKLPVLGPEPDPAAAATWYERAKSMRTGP